ncbi:MAG: M48 family metallopeptidase [Kiritimatiellae bacterium]|nr:M48 family metallopeptidase [Kiritimatiellia bacterium]
MNASKLLFSAGFAALLAAAGCRTVPETGRTQFVVLTSSYENNLGAANYKECMGQYKPVSDARQQEVLRRVGNALASVSGQADFKWEFNVLESSIENAFCLPGGKVAVYSGLMKRFDNEAELACVVAHEVGHAIARHGGERMSWEYLRKIGSLGLSEFAGTTVQDVYGIATQYGVMLPFSRSHETEADLIGLRLMAKAGYDPQAAVDFWQRFDKGDNDIITAITSTHPCDADRIAELNAHLGEAKSLYGQSAEKRGFGVKLQNGIPVSD